MPQSRPDDGEARGWARQLGTVGHVGTMFPVAIGLGLWLGYWADGALDTRPWLMLLGVGFGIAAATRNLVQSVARFQADEAQAERNAVAEDQPAAMLGGGTPDDGGEKT